MISNQIISRNDQSFQNNPGIENCFSGLRNVENNISEGGITTFFVEGLPR